MSTLDADLDATARPVTADGHEVTQAREAVVGSLPVRLRRSVGAWCFIDHYGPASVDGVASVDVPPHPHIGLQTVTWLLAGNVLHTDSPVVGAELAAIRDHDGDLPAAPSFEHVLFVTGGRARAAGTTLAPGSLLYLRAGPDRVPLTAPAGTTLMLLGGEPLGAPLLMWWNFVARTPAEVQAAASDWQAGRFGAVAGYAGEPLAAPALDPGRLITRASRG